MGKLIKFRPKPHTKFGHKRVKARKRLNLEQFGQLNLFTPQKDEAKVVNLKLNTSPFEEALILDDQNDPRARDAYQTAIARKDNIAHAYCNLGILESNTQQTALAIDCFTKALKHDPRHFEAHYNLANLYSDSGNLALARLHYEIAAEINPRDPNVHYNLGLVMVMGKDFQSALETLEKYKTLHKDEGDTEQANNLIKSIKNSIQTKKFSHEH